MANSIILEWDPQRVRAAVGSASSASPAVQRAISFALDSGEESDEVVTMAESVAAGLKENRVGKGDAIVVVERSAAELRVLCVPPVPPDELPEVVRFQANREFTSLSEGWLLDYVPLPALPNGQQRVLAGAISPQVATQIRGCCDTAGLHLKKVILRPFASGRLLAAAGMLQEDCILIEVLEESAELTVFSQQTMQLTRSVRISPEASAEAVAKQIQMELRRTLTAFRNQQQDAEIKRVLVMAPAEVSGVLESELPEKLSLQCLPVDPWSIFGNLGSAKGSAPDSSERFAAVLGGLCSLNEEHAEIDFVNPTRPPAPPSNQRRNILIGATVATLLLSLGGLYWMRSSQLNKQIEQIQQEVAELGREDQKYQDRIKEIEMLEGWVTTRPNWLAEMGKVSEQFPLPDDAIVDNLGLSLDEKNSQAVISITGKAASADVIRRLERDLRDPGEGREVSGRQNSPTTTGPYKFRFDETLTIDLAKQAEGEGGGEVEVAAAEVSDADDTDTDDTDTDDGRASADIESEDATDEGSSEDESENDESLEDPDGDLGDGADEPSEDLTDEDENEQPDADDLSDDDEQTSDDATEEQDDAE